MERSASEPTLLCTLAPGSPPMSSITCEQLAQLLLLQEEEGRCGTSREVLVVDCRFPFEYEGGHVRGAVNLFTEAHVRDYFFFGGAASVARVAAGPYLTVVLYCEFSSHRAPKCAQYLRSLDRKLNLLRYPLVSYPRVLLLRGGYSSFFKHDQVRPRTRTHGR
eukprot:TRINITY_DN4864_c0_g1_i1.p2 TRINITY_DN4864_c0_g1~~TRINITY_DN4864_c0_g1_i1.p2  ORF type:complete len:163 (+),score=48.02 TRINITY_DN4864_c0_g1_i1:276-764(+)